VPGVIGGLITLGFATGATAAAIGTSVILSAANFGISAIAKALMKAPGTTNPTDDIVARKENVRSPIAPRRVIYGRSVVGGVLTATTQYTDTGIDFYEYAFSLMGADKKASELEAVYADGRELVFAPLGDPAAVDIAEFAEVGIYFNRLFKRFHNGDPADTTQPFSELHTSNATFWTNDHLQRGVCKCHVRIQADGNVFPNGLPEMNFKIKGVEVYDPRTSTTAWSDNPALILRDFLTNTYYGLGYDASEVDDTTVNSAANACEELVATLPSGTEKRYTCNGTFLTSDKRTEVLKNIVDSMAGDLTFVSGKWQMFAGVWRGSVNSSAPLDEKTLRGPITFTPLSTKRNLYNAAKGTFVSPDYGYTPVDFPPVQNSTYISADGETLWANVVLPFTTSHTMAQRIANIVVESSRRQNALELKCNLAGYPYVAVDTVSVTNARLGYSGKTFRVLESKFVQEDDNGTPRFGVDLTMREHDSAVYTAPTLNALTAPPTSATLPTASISASDTTGATRAVNVIDSNDDILSSKYQRAAQGPEQILTFSGTSVPVSSTGSIGPQNVRLGPNQTTLLVNVNVAHGATADGDANVYAYIDDGAGHTASGTTITRLAGVGGTLSGVSTVSVPSGARNKIVQLYIKGTNSATNLTSTIGGNISGYSTIG
jgi:hypothetical protein